MAVLPSMFHPLDHEQRIINRFAMLDLMESTWVKGLLDKTLEDLRRFHLESTVTAAPKILRRPNEHDLPLPDFFALKHAYDTLNRQMAIVGEAGAGTTFALVQLLNHLIAEADKDDTKPIPTILTLSSWAKQPAAFEAWVRQEIRVQYGLPQAVVDDLVGGKQLAYLLDGLDEVGDSLRETCLDAIAEFVSYRHADFAITCCQADYEPIRDRLNVTGMVVVQPLMTDQFEPLLQSPELNGLRALYEQSELIRQFAQNPLLLSVITVAIGGLSASEIQADCDVYAVYRGLPSCRELLNDTNLLRDYFLDRYVSRRLTATNSKKEARIRHHLKWLATQLGNYHETDFQISSIQPEWLGESLRQKYRRAIVLILGLLGSLAGGFVGGLVTGWWTSVFDPTGVQLGAVLIGVCVGAILGLLSGLNSGRAAAEDDITPSDSLLLSTDALFVYTIPLLMVSCVVMGLYRGIIILALFGLIYGPLGGIGIVLYFTPVSSIVFWLVGSILAATAVSVLMALRDDVYVPSSSRPNIGVRHAFNRWMLMMGLTGVIVGVAVGILSGWWGLAIGIAAGFWFSLTTGAYNGGKGVFQHIILRYYLWREDHIPLWRYDKFLDYMAELVILRKVGGGYRFVHDYLRQYLASAAFVPDPMQKTE